MTKHKTIIHHLLEASQRPATQIAIRYKRRGEWVERSWPNYVEKIRSLVCALNELGLKPGDRAAIFANTRWEWAAADLAILGTGAVTVPIYPSSRAEDVEFILRDSGAKILIFENQDLLKKLGELSLDAIGVEQLISFESSSGMADSIISFSDLLERGSEIAEQAAGRLDETAQKNQLEDIATILYTSGTTGLPKGVVLTHRQVMSEVREVYDLLNVSSADSSLSFLPYSHILGRVEHWGAVYAGFTLNFAESLEKIGRNLLQTRPTLLIAVPRIFEKIYAGILSQAEANPLKHRMFQWAMKVGREAGQYRMQGKSIPWHLLPAYLTAKQLVFDTIVEKLGGRLRFAVSGGAPLPTEIGEFFFSAGVLILEGYGLTETTAAITVNTPLHFRFGTVGRPLPDVEIKIAADGEILVKSDKVMKEYYRNPEATADAFQDGYFATGDIGEFTKDGFLRITDRKKDLIKTSGGKYVAPQKLEGLLKLNPLISNVVIYGDQRKFVVALITVQPERARQLAGDSAAQLSLEEVIATPAVQKAVRSAVADANANLASFETIKGFHLLPTEFSVETGELTPSLKVKRKFCGEKYKALIDRLYD